MRAIRGTALVASLITLGAVGCGWQDDAPQATGQGAVAIIDLDEIARRLGSDKQIAAAVAQRQTALSQKLVDLAKSYYAQIAEQKNKLPAATPEEESRVTVASWEQQANANLTQVKQQAEADLANHRLQLIQSFRDQIKPVARRVAQQRGLGVIVTKNESVVYDFTAASDITSAVIDELLASGVGAAVPTGPVVAPKTAVAAQGPAAPVR